VADSRLRQRQQQQQHAMHASGTTAAALNLHPDDGSVGHSSDSSYEGHAAARKARSRKGGSVPRPLPPAPPAVQIPIATAAAATGSGSRSLRGSTASAAAAAANWSGALSSSSSSSGSGASSRRRALRLSSESRGGQLSALQVDTSSSTGVHDDVRLEAAAGASSVASSSAMSERYHRLQSMYRRVYKR
jgi:hypothetical protein